MSVQMINHSISFLGYDTAQGVKIKPKCSYSFCTLTKFDYIFSTMTKNTDAATFQSHQIFLAAILLNEEEESLIRTPLRSFSFSKHTYSLSC